MLKVLPFRRVLCLVLIGAAVALAPPSRAAAAPEVIRIGTLPGLRFDVSTFSVRPGADVELVFSNYDEMLHNFVVARPGSRARVLQAAISLGAGAADRDFVPASADVLWSSKVVPTGESFSLKFTAPKVPGNYPYLCTLPGHGVTMFGTMAVTNSPRPPVMTPVEQPAATVHATHIANATRGTVTRGFMPDAGPASVAVQLPGGVSYVFDAGAGRFRYAWTGGYMAMPASPERGLAKIDGQIFYREAGYPLRLGATSATAPKLVEFKGYTLDADRIPEFETTVDGITVRERVEVKQGRLLRRFRIVGVSTAWFAAQEDAVVEVSGATREGGFYKLTGAAAQDFTVSQAVPPPAVAPAPAAAPTVTR